MDDDAIQFARRYQRQLLTWTLRQLGALYLDDYNRPDLAVECLKEFQESEKSGARTLYDLGRGFEMMGQADRAIKYYQQAAAFEDVEAYPLDVLGAQTEGMIGYASTTWGACPGSVTVIPAQG